MAAFDYSSSFAGINNAISNIGKQNELAYQRQTLAKLGQQIQSGDYGGAAQAAFAAGDAGTGLGLLKLGQAEKDRASDASLAQGIFGGGVPSQSLGTVGQGGYFGKTASAESSGNPAAKNPNSSATGLYQFTDGTWADLMKSNPELGLTADGRTDPVQQQKAMRAFTSQNAKILQSQGIPPNDANLYVTHFLGAQGGPTFIKGLQSNPNAPASAYVDPRAVAANRSIFFNPDGTQKTAGQVYQQLTGRFGNGSTAIAQLQGGGQPAQPQPAQVAQGGAPVETITGDDPAKLRADAAYYEQSNPEAARQLRARADAVEQQRGNPAITPALTPPVQVAQAAPQPGTPAADPPAPGAANTQFVIPGTNTTIDQQTLSSNPRIQNMVRALGMARTERGQAMIKQALDLEIADAKQRQAINQPTDVQKNYEAARKQGYQGTFFDYQQELRKAGATNVNVDQKGETKFEEAMGTAQAKRWNGYIEEGDKAQTRLADIQTLRDASRRLGSQGSTANLKSLIGPYAESLGINVDGLSDIQLYESITNRLAPQLRAPGSGSTSDIEFKGFMKGIGPLSNNPAAREMILDTFEAASRNDVARSQIASRLASKEIDRGQAERELRALPDPMTAFREFRKQNPDAVGQAIKESARIDSAQRAAPPIATVEGYNALKPGDKYTDPDGNIRTKR